MVKLTESTIYIRTKCAVEAVKKLNLWGCNIDDISICERMQNLEVLSLRIPKWKLMLKPLLELMKKVPQARDKPTGRVNKVSTLESLKTCTKLTELYLRKNCIESLFELEHLKGLPCLKVLWIDENPCAMGDDHRSRVLRMLPNLTKLDDKPVTLEDHLLAESETLTECEQLAACRTSRSSTLNEDMMCRSMYVEPRFSRHAAHLHRTDLMGTSMYVGSAGPTNPIVDTVMQPQISNVEYSDDERQWTPRETQTTRPISQSVYESIQEDAEDWQDFGTEDDFRHMDALSSRMFMSMHENIDRYSRTNGRSMSVPRRRVPYPNRQQSTSPARDHRLNKIMSAVSVLLDELDQDGLRRVVEEAQNRIKKQR